MGDAAAEGAVMERLTGPTMPEALTAGSIDEREAGTVLAAVLRQLRAVNPTMTSREVELLGAAEELIRSLVSPREP